MKKICAAFMTLTLLASPALAVDQRAMLKRQIQTIMDADVNKDGAVTRAEVAAMRATQFKRYDLNSDGFLSTADIPAAMAMMGANDIFNQMKQAFDRNRDGKISRAELVGGPAPSFNLCDTNRDNKVTAAERDAALAKMN